MLVVVVQVVTAATAVVVVVSVVKGVFLLASILFQCHCNGVLLSQFVEAVQAQVFLGVWLFDFDYVCRRRSLHVRR